MEVEVAFLVPGRADAHSCRGGIGLGLGRRVVKGSGGACARCGCERDKVGLGYGLGGRSVCGARGFGD